MKKATYQFQTKRYGKLTGYVSVSRGKVSVSLPNINRYSMSAAEKYQARELGKKIAELDFQHEAVISVQSEDAGSLVATLTEQTQELKTEFIRQTREWAKVRFEKMIKDLGRQMYEWYNEYKVLYVVDIATRSNVQITSSYSSKNLHKMKTNKRLMEETVAKGLKAYKEERVKAAIDHYENSILKLASRLNAKGVTDDMNFTVSSARVGVNFECYIKWDGGMLKAWTIIAWGPIVSPHYRYLIK